MSAFAEASSCIAGLFQATSNQREQEEEQDQAVQYKYNTTLKSITPEVRKVKISCSQSDQVSQVNKSTNQVNKSGQMDTGHGLFENSFLQRHQCALCCFCSCSCFVVI